MIDQQRIPLINKHITLLSQEQILLLLNIIGFCHELIQFITLSFFNWKLQIDLLQAYVLSDYLIVGWLREFLLLEMIISSNVITRISCSCLGLYLYFIIFYL